VRAACLALSLALAPAAMAQDATDDTDAPAVQEPAPEARPSLVVGVKSSPPFAFRGADGRWQGISLDLWGNLAEDADIPWTLREVQDLDTLLAEVEDGTIDVGAPALTVTATREEAFDFTHAYYETGYAIAVRRKLNPLGYLGWLLSPTFWRVVAGLFTLLLVVGALVWLAERRKNEEFGGTTAEGLASGLWWSAVTMTTVGYGDKSPRTLLGRLVALVWMFASIIVISSFTAAIASSMTVTRLVEGITGPEDLPGHTLGTVAASTSEAWLRDNHLRYEAYPSADAALDALADDEVDAVVYDAPILQYQVRARGDRTLRVLDDTFGRQVYAFALGEGSPHLERINQALLERLERSSWDDTVTSYVGD